MPKEKSVKSKKRKNNLENGNNSLAPPRAGLSFVFCISKATTKTVVAHFILPLILQTIGKHLFFFLKLIY